MHYLLLSVVMNVALFVAFRTFSQWRIRVFQAVVINYIVCSIMGGIFLQGTSLNVIWPIAEPWQFIAILLGLLFISTFYVLGLTTNNFGITIATISSKMSLVVPVIFGLYIFKIAARPFDFWNYLGVVLALTAVVFTAIKKREPARSIPESWGKRFLPLALFLLAGALDTLINYTNYRYLNPELEVAFIWTIFITAATVGILILLVQRKRFEWRSLGGGLYLGIPNFFSMYFIMRALSAFNNDGAVLYPIFNVGIILFSTLAAVTIFKEKLLTINKFGIILAVISVIMISYWELMIWLN